MTGIGPTKYTQLVQTFGTAQKSYTESENNLREIIGEDLARDFVDFRRKFDLQSLLLDWEKKHIIPLTRRNPHFPKRLLEISDPPICLYARGAVGQWDPDSASAIGIVGTRRPTEYGRQIAQRISTDLAICGITIVSGMAYGIDSIAHQAALDVHGRTIAFLGCGVDVIYPVANRRLYNRIIDEGGIVMSEFPPGMTTLPGLFVARNRLVSGMSQGVLVVEGASKSGTLITARYAAVQGRDVFAVPGPVTSELSEAPNMLIREGARLVGSAADILAEYGISASPRRAQLDLSLFSADQQAILRHLTGVSRTVDELIESSGLPSSSLMNTLTLLEMDGVVRANAAGKYEISC